MKKKIDLSYLGRPLDKACEKEIGKVLEGKTQEDEIVEMMFQFLEDNHWSRGQQAYINSSSERKVVATAYLSAEKIADHLFHIDAMRYTLSHDGRSYDIKKEQVSSTKRF